MTGLFSKRQQKEYQQPHCITAQVEVAVHSSFAPDHKPRQYPDHDESISNQFSPFPGRVFETTQESSHVFFDRCVAIQGM